MILLLYKHRTPMVYFRFPKDVWIVDLDSNKITPPITLNREDAIPQLPKSESIILKNNLKSVINIKLLNSMIKRVWYYKMFVLKIGFERTFSN